MHPLKSKNAFETDVVVGEAVGEVDGETVGEVVVGERVGADITHPSVLLPLYSALEDDQPEFDEAAVNISVKVTPSSEKDILKDENWLPEVPY